MKIIPALKKVRLADLIAETGLSGRTLFYLRKVQCRRLWETSIRCPIFWGRTIPTCTTTVTSGGNRVPCSVAAAQDCPLSGADSNDNNWYGFSAGAGDDQATGWGKTPYWPSRSMRRRRGRTQSSFRTPFWGPLYGDLVIAGERLHPSPVLAGSFAQHRLVHHGNPDHVPEKADHLSERGSPLRYSWMTMRSKQWYTRPAGCKTALRKVPLGVGPPILL